VIYHQATFKLTANIKVDPDRGPEKVKEAVKEAMKTVFSFDQRSFGQPVSLSEVMAVMQAVPGVIAVDLDELCRTDGIGGSGLEQSLPSGMPEEGNDGQMQGAEILTVDPGSINITVIT
jgi:hypothetical protein